MSEFPCKHVGLGLWLAVLLWPIIAPACDVPVFRYALERWNPDPYVVVVFHREPFTSEQQSEIEELEKTGREALANVVVRKVNVSGAMPAAFQSLWKAQGDPVLPWMVVRYPANTGIEPSAWTGKLSAGIAKSLVDSPARREIARQLLNGKTAVWLLLESGDKTRDDTLGRLLETESRNLERTLELPTPSPDDPPLSIDLPLKIAFSTVRVARSDPAERWFVNQLLNWEPHLRNTANALLFPVFGRGRALPPALGEKIRTQAIGAMARLLTGPCSCQIKEMNAGFDLLMAARWEGLLEGGVTTAQDPPPLVGLSRFASAMTNQAAVPPGKGGTGLGPGLQGSSNTIEPAISMAALAEASERLAPDHLIRNLALVLGGGVVFVVIATLVLKAKAGRTRQ